MRVSYPDVVTFRITSICNQNCQYCYGPKNIPHLSLSRLKMIFQQFFEGGVKGAVITGGEPLLRRDVDQILEELKKHSFKIYLDTNGDFFFEHKDVINTYVDVLGLPLDSSFDKGSFRKKNNFAHILTILDSYKNYKNCKRPTLRAGTVLTKKNLSDLENIGRLLSAYKVDIWKIYQFIPGGVNGTKNRADLALDDQIFAKEAQIALRTFSKFFKVVISSKNDRNRAYFIVNPDGQVIIPNESHGISEEVVLGDVLDPNVFRKWRKIVSIKNYTHNIKVTFG